jgi:hypothetical protein
LAYNNERISWKTLQSDMEQEFGRLRSRNDIKNIWNSRKRRLIRQSENVLDPLPLEDVFVMEIFNGTGQPLFVQHQD